MAATKTAPRKGKTKVGLRPLGAKLLVQRDEAEDRTQSGIYLPEQAKDKPKSGVVLAAGEGAINTETGERIPMSVSVGDRVLFSSYAGSEIKIDSEDYLIMSEDEILAIVEG